MILIDTHVWIWMICDPGRLTASARALLEAEPRILLSTVSVYETMVAVEKGRLQSRLTPEELVRRWLGASSVVCVAPATEIIIRSRVLRFQHADPFDRMIASTAICEKASLMTADNNLLTLDWLPTIAAA